MDNLGSPPAIHDTAVAGQSAILRKRMRVLAGDLTKYTFDLAEAFLLAQETRCYAEWGFDSIGEYAELELGIKPRKAQYLAHIAKVCRDCGLKRTDYEGAGLTNLRAISTLDPKGTYYNREEKQHESLVDHIVDLVASAPELSTQEVEERVAHLKGMDGENAMVTKSYSVTLSAYENVIKPCFESIRKRLGSAGRDGTGAAREFSDGAVLECLCAEWNSDPRNFMEEPDESHEQIEVPLEETNDHTPNQEGTGSTEALPNSGRNVRDDGLGCAGDTHQIGAVDSSEVPQESLQGQSQSFIIPTEE